jgi:transposase-like protein
MSAGRKTLGPALVHHLQGSLRAKQRLELILQTLAGQLTIVEACRRLGIGEAMFYRLRARVLEAGLAQLEPRPIGRPPRTASPEQQRITQLEQQLEELQTDVQLAQVREEIALVLPHVVQQPDDAAKKTTPNHRRRRKRPIPKNLLRKSRP